MPNNDDAAMLRRDEFTELAERFGKLWQDCPELSVTVVRTTRLGDDRENAAEPRTWRGRVRIQWDDAERLSSRLRALMQHGSALLQRDSWPTLETVLKKHYLPDGPELFLDALLVAQTDIWLHFREMGRPEQFYKRAIEQGSTPVEQGHLFPERFRYVMHRRNLGPASQRLIETHYPVSGISKYCEEFARYCAGLVADGVKPSGSITSALNSTGAGDVSQAGTEPDENGYVMRPVDRSEYRSQKYIAEEVLDPRLPIERSDLTNIRKDYAANKVRWTLELTKTGEPIKQRPLIHFSDFDHFQTRELAKLPRKASEDDDGDLVPSPEEVAREKARVDAERPKR